MINHIYTGSIIPKHSTYPGSWRSLFIAVLVLLFAVLLTCHPLPANCAVSKEFPEFPGIQPNVAFWEKIYGDVSVNSAVIHDKDDLSRIYEVVHLLDKDLPGAARLNRSLLSHTRDKYATILKSLSKGKKAANHDEKRIAALFSGGSDRKHMARAAQNIRVQTGMKERFRKGVVLSGAYSAEIRRIFLTYGLPPELAFLPHVESSFNTRAYSKFGAAGIWQFTRATGRQFLRIDEAVDERRDPIIAAHAAAKYLRNSYEQLGNWPLALTAYNYGTAGMLRAKKAKGTYEKIFKEYREGYFKFASRNFYSEFLAALRVAEKLERDPSVRRDPPLQVYSFILSGYLHIDDLLHHFSLSEDTLRILNPGLRPPVFKGEKYLPKGYSLHLPSRSTIPSLAASLPSSYYKTAQKISPSYRVKKGDTAGKIALLHRVSIEKLIAANNLDTMATIYIGRKLHVPTPANRKPSTVTIPQLTETAKKKLHSDEPVTQRTTIIQPSLRTLSDSKKNPAGHDDIGAKPARVALGQTITMQITRSGSILGNIMVNPEESLGLYALWLQISQERLRQLNTMKKDQTIHPGQTVTLDFSRMPADKFSEQRADFLKETEDDFFSAYKIIELTQYTVHKGDTLWDICRNKYEIPLWLLKKYNSDIDFSRLHAAQELAIPVLKAI